MYSRKLFLLVITGLVITMQTTMARPGSNSLDSLDRVTYEYTGPAVQFGPQNATVELDVPDLFDINDMDVTVHIDHVWTGDVELRLESPAGTSILLMTSLGGSQDNIHNTEFNDEASLSIVSGSPPFSGSFIPMEPLSGFDGEQGTGTWRLHLNDHFPSLDDGQLNWWTLTIGGRIGGAIEGMVRSLETNEPVAGATVEFVETDFITETNALGEYILLGPDGTYDMLVSKAGWCEQLFTEVELTDLDTIDMDIDLAHPEALVSRSSLNVLVLLDSTETMPLELQNDGDCDLTWSAEVFEPWVELVSFTGSLPPGQSTDLELVFNAEGLEADDYYTRLVITHNAENTPIEVPVIFSVTEIISATGEGEALPTQFALPGNYPNPFNATTVIPFELPSAAEVELRLYSVTGRLITTLHSGLTPAGFHEVRYDAGDLASGTYFVRMTAEDFIATNKIVLLK